MIAQAHSAKPLNEKTYEMRIKMVTNSTVVETARWEAMSIRTEISEQLQHRDANG